MPYHEEELRRTADEEKLAIVRCAMPQARASAYVRSEAVEGGVIAVDRALEGPDACAAVAESLGYHFTACGNLVCAAPRARERQQRRARGWAYRRMLPLEAIARAWLAFDANAFAVAEALGVPIRFLESAIAQYAEHYGVSMRTGAYHIYFEPYFHVEATIA